MLEILILVSRITFPFLPHWRPRYQGLLHQQPGGIYPVPVVLLFMHGGLYVFKSRRSWGKLSSLVRRGNPSHRPRLGMRKHFQSPWNLLLTLEWVTPQLSVLPSTWSHLEQALRLECISVVKFVGKQFSTQVVSRGVKRELNVLKNGGSFKSSRPH